MTLLTPDGARGIAGILLAGGYSRRFGADKLLHPFPDGTPIALASAKRLVQACPWSISVLRPEQAELRRCLMDAGISVQIDRAPEGGLGKCLARAIQATPEARGWVIALADMPFLMCSTLQAVALALQNGSGIVVPRYLGRQGHPVGFSKEFFKELSQLQGDKGARCIIESHSSSITFLDVEDPGIHQDIDTPEDLVSQRPEGA
ncbi:molybdenum cofactor cytidylyltransferase [Gammaproteobacteria bacterium]